MINFRLDNNCVDDLLALTRNKYPLDRALAKQICSGSNPTSPRAQVYGCYKDGKELVAIMTATYTLFFPHEDGTKVVQISGAYTKEEERHSGFASQLIKAIESDAVKYYHADYLCCDATAAELYEKNGFIPAPAGEKRMWKPLRKV